VLLHQPGVDLGSRLRVGTSVGTSGERLGSSSLIIGSFAPGFSAKSPNRGKTPADYLNFSSRFSTCHHPTGRGRKNFSRGEDFCGIATFVPGDRIRSDFGAGHCLDHRPQVRRYNSMGGIDYDVSREEGEEIGESP